MVKTLITYFSGSGNTREMAEYVAKGAQNAGSEVTLKSVDEVDVSELNKYQAVIAGSPTYYGGMSWQLKQLFDDSVKFQGRLQGKIGGAFSSSANPGGGNETTVMSILQAMLIHGMIVQGNPMGDHYGPIAINAPDERAQRQCTELGERVVALAKKVFE